MTAKIRVFCRGFQIQLFHAYIKYNKGFEDHDNIASSDHSEMKNCCVIIISFL